jgi:general secretion pathway protein N
MSRVIWGVTLVLVLLFSFLAAAPARLLTLVLPEEQLVVEGLTGTLWRGQASRCLLRIPAGFLHLGAVQWSLAPLSLLTLAPQVQLRSDWGEQTLSGTLVLRGVRDLDLRDVKGRVSADLLRHLAPLALAGSFTAQVPELQLRDGLLYSGAGRLEWQNAAWNSPRGMVDLGSYTLQFEQLPGEALQGLVQTLSGPLEADGNLQVAGRNYTLDLMLSSPETLDPQLQQALSLMATPESEGYRLNLQGDF